MAALKPITAAALLVMLTFPAHADVSGPACVTDGDTLVVNGKRQRTRCVGGSRVAQDREGDRGIAVRGAAGG